MSQLNYHLLSKGKVEKFTPCGKQAFLLWSNFPRGLLAGKPIESVVDWLIVHFLNTLLQTGWPIAAEIFFKWGLV